MANPPAIGDLSNDIKGLVQKLASGDGGANLKITPQAHQQWSSMIQGFSSTLADQRLSASELTDYGNVGTLSSANQTRDLLASSNTTAAVDALDQYIAYLGQLQKLVDAAYNQMQAQDNAT